MVTRYTGGNIHNFKTALKVLLVGILLGTAAAVSTPFANQEGVVRRLNEKQEYVTNLLPDHTYGIVQKPAHSAPADEFGETQGAPSLLQDQAMQDHSPRESANIKPPRSDLCSQEWVGGCIGPCSTDTRPRRHHLVVSHCTHDIGWLQTWLNINRITFETITVVSKCGQVPCCIVVLTAQYIVFCLRCFSGLTCGRGWSSWPMIANNGFRCFSSRDKLVKARSSGTTVPSKRSFEIR